MNTTIKNSSRRFGCEIELNSYDGNSRSRGLNDLPTGIYETANLIKNLVGNSVDITKWQYTHNNERWAIKPDSSCGLEVCSPPFSGINGVQAIASVVDGITKNNTNKADKRCSFHAHVEIADFSQRQIVFLIKKWVAYELFFFLMTQPYRWLNQYCLPVGFFCDFDSETIYNNNNLLVKLGQYKYFSINLFHYMKNKKKTIEFRIMGNEACISGEDSANWCKLLLCFVDKCSNYVGLTETKLEYESFADCIDFLSLNKYFADDEIIMWIISKLNNVIEYEKKIRYDPKKFFWDSVIISKKQEIENCILMLEKFLK
jgi:hypothetical protein